MTILQVVKDVCATVGVLVPQSVFSNITGNRTMQEMVSLANEMAQRIAYDTRDWTALRKTATHSGDGAAVSFPLPANYKRMLLTANVWRSTTTLYPMVFVPDLDEWLNRRARNHYNAQGEWTIIGGQIYIAPTMSGPVIYDPGPPEVAAVAAVTATYAYLDKNCIKLASGGNGDVFMSDTDSFVLDERLLKLGMIWQWKAQKGSAYAEDMGTYGDALTYAMGHDSPAPIILGRKPISRAATVAYPWPVPT